MKSSLEKAVVKKVKATQTKAEQEAAEKARKEREFQALLPETREERAKIVYPSITDGKWEYYFAAGHWRLKFFVKSVEFEIHDVYIPADSGTPTEGYYGHDAYWTPALYVSPKNEYTHYLGTIGDVDDSFIAALKRTDKDAERTRVWLAEEVKKINDSIAEYVEYYLLHQDDYSYRERLRNESRRGC